MADKNKLSDKSDKSINDVSFELLPEIKNLRLANVNKVIIGNINIKDMINPYNCWKLRFFNQNKQWINNIIYH